MPAERAVPSRVERPSPLPKGHYLVPSSLPPPFGVNGLFDWSLPHSSNSSGSSRSSSSGRTTLLRHRQFSKTPRSVRNWIHRQKQHPPRNDSPGIDVLSISSSSTSKTLAPPLFAPTSSPAPTEDDCHASLPTPVSSPIRTTKQAPATPRQSPPQFSKPLKRVPASPRTQKLDPPRPVPVPHPKPDISQTDDIETSSQVSYQTATSVAGTGNVDADMYSRRKAGGERANVAGVGDTAMGEGRSKGMGKGKGKGRFEYEEEDEGEEGEGDGQSEGEGEGEGESESENENENEGEGEEFEEFDEGEEGFVDEEGQEEGDSQGELESAGPDGNEEESDVWSELSDNGRMRGPEYLDLAAKVDRIVSKPKGSAIQESV
ncbi:hypothetical protein FS749_004477 [Ceratobasidium sp. UAMH 11750]|nr:hypothetical protein FS749_004477 [Ceratobasidium sp. UAMH 11750]